jgi:hypothetical protein
LTNSLADSGQVEGVGYSGALLCVLCALISVFSVLNLVSLFLGSGQVPYGDNRKKRKRRNTEGAEDGSTEDTEKTKKAQTEVCARGKRLLEAACLPQAGATKWARCSLFPL